MGNGAQTTLVDVEYINSGTGNLAPPSAAASKLALSDDVYQICPIHFLTEFPQSL